MNDVELLIIAGIVGSGLVFLGRLLWAKRTKPTYTAKYEHKNGFNPARDSILQAEEDFRNAEPLRRV